ncbi:MAG: DUF4080 domain-containing protein [Clostridia bacterium]
MKILLTTLNSKYSHINISLYYLKENLANICDVSLKNFTINDNLDNILDKIIQCNSDIVCFGCYIWNIEQTLKICDNLKRLKPDITIVLGGPEVSYNSKILLSNHSFLSCIICGEAEVSIVKLVEDFNTNNLQKIYNIPVNVEDIPCIADNILNNYDNRVVYFETSRGCPYRCSYCLSCIDKNIKYFDMLKVQKELLILLKKNVKQIRFIDRTFNSNKKRAIKLWDFLLNNRIDTTFHFEICASLIDEETISFLSNIPKDVFQFEIGIQSTNESTLVAINRNYNWNFEKSILNSLRKNNNITLHTDLIIGLPYENLDIFKSSFNELYKVNSHEIQLGFLKFLKGTTLYENKDKYNYIYNAYPPYEILQNSFLSYNDVRFLKQFEIIFDSIYNTHYYNISINFLSLKYTSPFDMYEDITKYFLKNGLLDRKISIDEIFEKLIYMYKDEEYISTLRQCLTYDYFIKFKGTREWFFNKYLENKKTLLNKFVEKNRQTLFFDMNNNDIYKKYKFTILDIDIKTYEQKEAKIYYTEK